MWSFFSEWSTSWAKNSRWASWYWSCPQSGETPYAHHAHWIVGFWREDDVRLMMSRKCPIAICSLVQPLLECLVEIWKESGNLYPFIWTWRTKFWAWLLPGRTCRISVQHVRSLRSWLKRRSKRVTSAFWRWICQGQERTAWWKVVITSEDWPVYCRLCTVLPLFISSPLLLPLLSWRLRTGILCPTYMLKWVSFLLVVLRCVNVCGFRPHHANGFSWKYISLPHSDSWQ